MGATPQVAWEDVEGILDQALTLASDDRRAFLEQTRSVDPRWRPKSNVCSARSKTRTDSWHESGLDFAAALVARVANNAFSCRESGFGTTRWCGSWATAGWRPCIWPRTFVTGGRSRSRCLRPELSAGFGARRFAREIAFAAQLNHPHILPLHDSGTLDLGMGEPVLFYTMPYVEGRSLRDRLREESQLPIREALRIASQVAEALEYAHRHDVVHRDIKPENILLNDDHALVADFGIARALDRRGNQRGDAAGVVLGTPAYMSPEQAARLSSLMDGATCTVSAACCTRCLPGIHRLPGPLCRRYLPAMRWTPCPHSGRYGGRHLSPWNWQFNAPWPRRPRTDLQLRASLPRRWRRRSRIPCAGRPAQTARQRSVTLAAVVVLLLVMLGVRCGSAERSRSPPSTRSVWPLPTLPTIGRHHPGHARWEDGRSAGERLD